MQHNLIHRLSAVPAISEVARAQFKRLSGLRAGFLSTTRRTAHYTALSATLACAIFSAPMPASAQNLFAPAVTVNENVITTYEIQQRARFLSLVGQPGGTEAEAREELILDSLKRAAMNEVGMSMPEEAVLEAMTALAGRANMDLEQFTTALAAEGVSRETLRDVAEIGIAWRDYITGRFLAAARPSEAEIDRAMGTAGAGALEVLLAEIIMPINAENAAQVQDLALQIAEIDNEKTFATAAAQFSAADTRLDGGRLPWLPLGRLPARLQDVVLDLDTGEVTDPIPVQGALAIFRMRGLRETSNQSARYAAIEYMVYRLAALPGDDASSRAAAQKVIDRADTCDDLYGIAKGQDPSVLDHITAQPGEIPSDIALALSRLDENEATASVTRNNGATRLVVMLCGRTAEIYDQQATAEGEEAVDPRENVARALTQQRLNALSDSLLTQWRANARIVQK